MYEPTKSGKDTIPGKMQFTTPYNDVSPNPYGDTIKADAYDLPVIPPPPMPDRKRKRNIIILTIIILLSIFNLIAGTINFAISRSLVHSEASSPIVTKVPSPTATATQATASYSALSVLKSFIAAGFNPDTKYNLVYTNWKCCSVYPEGGAYEWYDYVDNGVKCEGPGSCYVGIATFASYKEALEDANSLNRQEFSTQVVNNCLLFYDPAFDYSHGDGPSYELAQYEQVMQTICTQ